MPFGDLVIQWTLCGRNSQTIAEEHHFRSFVPSGCAVRQCVDKFLAATIRFPDLRMVVVGDDPVAPQVLLEYACKPNVIFRLVVIFVKTLTLLEIRRIKIHQRLV